MRLAAKLRLWAPSTLAPNAAWERGMLGAYVYNNIYIYMLTSIVVDMSEI